MIKMSRTAFNIVNYAKDGFNLQNTSKIVMMQIECRVLEVAKFYVYVLYHKILLQILQFLEMRIKIKMQIKLFWMCNEIHK